MDPFTNMRVEYWKSLCVKNPKYPQLSAENDENRHVHQVNFIMNLWTQFNVDTCIPTLCVNRYRNCEVSGVVM